MLCACFVASLIPSLEMLHGDVFVSDALVHQFWMWQFRDPQLFTDPLTAELRASARYPAGYEALFRVATGLTGPIAFGEWLGIALATVSAWLVFLIVRDHVEWSPAAWIGAALFLGLDDIHRFPGGFPRAFVHPVVLLTVLLAMRGHYGWAALVAASGALLYPPAALLAVGVLVVSAVQWRAGRPYLEGHRAAFAGLALALAGGIVLAGGDGPRVFTAAEARAYPEFGEQGGLHFFVSSPIEYLRQNRSGFGLRGAGSVLALALLALVLMRPSNLRLLRREVLALPVVALCAFTLAQLVLFKLYLPHRYTYPLVAFMAIGVAVALRPTWIAFTARERSRRWTFALLAVPVAAYLLGVYVFPLGPMSSLTSVARWAAIAVLVVAVGVLALIARRGIGPAMGAIATGLVLVAALLLVPDHARRGRTCPTGPTVERLAQLPKGAVIAGDPQDLECLPGTTRRAVVISTQLAPSYEVDYFLQARARMFDTLRAYYGPSADAIKALRDRYRATHLWVRRGALTQELSANGVRWRKHQAPYGQFVRSLVRKGEPAALRLPVGCRLYQDGADQIYDIACLGDAHAQRAVASRPIMPRHRTYRRVGG